MKGLNRAIPALLSFALVLGITSPAYAVPDKAVAINSSASYDQDVQRLMETARRRFAPLAARNGVVRAVPHQTKRVQRTLMKIDQLANHLQSLASGSERGEIRLAAEAIDSVADLLDPLSPAEFAALRQALAARAGEGTPGPGKCVDNYLIEVTGSLYSFWYYWVVYFPLGPYVVVFGAVDMAVCIITPLLDPA